MIMVQRALPVVPYLSGPRRHHCAFSRRYSSCASPLQRSAESGFGYHVSAYHAVIPASHSRRSAAFIDAGVGAQSERERESAKGFHLHR